MAAEEQQAKQRPSEPASATSRRHLGWPAWGMGEDHAQGRWWKCDVNRDTTAHVGLPGPPERGAGGDPESSQRPGGPARGEPETDFDSG